MIRKRVKPQRMAEHADSMVHPVNNVVWINVNTLIANDYNPNNVQPQEMRLLKHSIMISGWIQPILVTQEHVIIDGFHRATLVKSDSEVRGLTNSKVPVVVMDLTEPERMLLTIRINRAKGTHIAFKMANVVKALINDYGMDTEEIQRAIGATAAEVDLLLYKDVFAKMDIENHTYSNAWFPK